METSGRYEMLSESGFDNGIDIEARYNQIYKIILIGDASVGKTSIIAKYLTGTFPQPNNTIPTIAAEFATKIIQIKEGGYIKAQIWDTAGQERYKSITSAYYKGSKGAFVVYDISRKSTFDNVDKWIGELKNNGSEDVFIMLVGNKSDLKDKREISEEEVQKKAQVYNVAFCETSALEGKNIEYAFENLVNEIAKKVEKEKEKNLKNVKNMDEGKTITLDTNIIKDKINGEKDNNNSKGNKNICC